MSQDTVNEKTICQNCGNEFEGKFCPNCGQSSDVKRLTRKELWTMMLKTLFKTDVGFMYTFKMLFYKPGTVIKGYIEGKRKKYYAPFSMMFISVAFFALIKFILNEVAPPAQTPNSLQIFQENVPTWIRLIISIFQKKTVLILILTLPFWVLSIKACYGKKFRQKYNSAEILSMACYMNAQFFFLLSLKNLLFIFIPYLRENLELAFFWPFVIFLSWDMFSLSEFQKKYKNITRAVLSFLLFFAMLFVVFIIILVIVIGLSELFQADSGTTFQILNSVE